jgi:ferredoxin
MIQKINGEFLLALLHKLTCQAKLPLMASTTMMKFRHVTILKDRCRNCGICMGECPEKAILRMGDKCMIDTNKCNGCRLCIPVCPVSAIKEELSLWSIFGRNGQKSIKQRKGCV